ncbi:MAG TPA: SdrD B-like domain-containing protein [Hydrogenophaga sp.]|nr:SdrD B-like domain-containing protein [Hydrogenophaga sp.]
MTPLGKLSPIALAILMSALSVAKAQTASTPAAQAPATDTEYVDRVIEGLEPEVQDDVQTYDYDKTGWPRFLKLETRLGTQPFDEQRSAKLGVSAYGVLETPNHGTLSLDGNYAPDSSDGTLTLRQTQMPLGGGWLGNHSLGYIDTPSPGITRLPSRVFVPTSILEGLSGEWEQPARGWQFQVATGEPGQLEILPATGFQRLPGRRTVLGAQWRLGADATADPLGLSLKGWTMAVQHENAQGVSNFQTPRAPEDVVDANATLLALRHEGDRYRLKAQAVSSGSSALDGGRSGYWIDGEFDEGPRQYGAGLYRLEPGLNWANLPMVNDVSGAYLRAGWRTRQWSADTSIDWLQSISGRSNDGFYSTTGARWRLGRDTSLGAGFSIRRFDGDAWSSFGDLRWDNDWGTSGLRLEFEGGDSRGSAQQISYDQEWPVPQGWSLTSSLGLGRAGVQPSTGQPAEDLWSAALSVSAPLNSRASVRGNFSTENGSSGQRRQSINLGANWRIDPRWSLEGSYVRTTGRRRTRFTIDPLAPPETVENTSAYRSFFVVLRYEWQAGSRSVPLGGKAADGGGRIAGTVFFDDNRSGTQEASEAGVPNVTVFLDNRYAVRTDSQGRFEFPFVATGARTVTVRNETLPLPWSVVDEGQVRVDVRLRESNTLSLPVQRSE